MSKTIWAALAVSMSLASAACAQPAPAGPQPKNDYTQDAAWLCRPGRQDACAQDQTTTVVAADGSTKVEPFKADPKAPIDCFYVYPTVSTDPGGNSDMTIDPAETTVAEQQAARFGQACRVFAPMYRQVTLAALRQVMRGQASPGDENLAYGDVLDAWKDYLARDNKGRGVVLIGHSQGSRVLLRLLAQEIDGKPVQKQLVSALIIGMNTMVDPATDSYGSIKMCRKPGQTGCIVSYVSFRASSPPEGAAFFGKAEGDKRAACVNPAALAGGEAPLHSYFSDKTIAGAPRKTPWVKGKDLTTTFVSVPGLVTAQCATSGPYDYLAIKVHGDPADPRVDDIPGDLLVMGMPLKAWGLHLADVNLAMGDLVALVEAQGKGWK
ncbi:lysophospholipase [Caulobacter sp. D4A]|uniref:DUF3089 domain-containing protein n=1 Tax=unclassified Caulobacter TaxID=2648921 RepID=UPI000D738887|nr:MULTISPECIES: DUF3089 domain-containing protein [unclassified Caulobacter]PXA82479.1 lysophospholipase [Caulobacter sp. D4A]PXA93612.1 lysophospholipase [Caulobacter sp. D5]